MLEIEALLKFIEIFVAPLTYKQRQLLVGSLRCIKIRSCAVNNCQARILPHAKALWELAQLLPIVEGSECYIIDDRAIAAASDLAVKAELASRQGKIEFTRRFWNKFDLKRLIQNCEKRKR